jgi:hypothetical protein
MNAFGEQFKEFKGIVKDSAAKLKGLQDEGLKVAKKAQAEGLKVAEKARAEGLKVAKKVRATMDETRAKGTKVVDGLVSEQTLKELLDRFGGLKVPELVEKLKATDLTKHTEALRNEVLALLRLASAEQVEKLRVANEKLAKELASLRTMKPQVTRLADDVKTLKTAAKKKA